MLVEAALARRTGAVHALVPEGEHRASAVADAVAELLTPDKVLGALVVDSAPPAAAVKVDGNAAGAAPARVRVRAGTHDVAVSLPGYVPARRRVDVRPGAETPLRLVLKPLSTPPPGSAPVSAGPSAGLIAAITGGAIVAVGAGTAVTLDVILESGGTGDFAARDAMLNVEKVAAVAAVAGGVVVAAGAAMLVTGS